MRTIWIMLVALSLACAFAGAEEKPSTAPAGETIEATDIDKLKESVGKTVTAHGKVSDTFKANSGRILINFEGANRDFVAMITKDSAEAVNAGFDGGVTKAVDGKTINVTGEVKLFRDKPQIEVSKPEQIKIEAEK